jgi:hypothetical protein
MCNQYADQPSAKVERVIINSSVWQTISTSRFVIEVKNGNANVREEMDSATGQCEE